MARKGEGRGGGGVPRGWRVLVARGVSIASGGQEARRAGAEIGHLN